MSDSTSPSATRRTVVLIAIAAAIPVIFFAAWVTFINARQERSDARLSAQRTLNRVVSRVGNELRVQVEIAEILATSPALDKNDLALFYEEALRIKNARPLWQTVALVNLNGQQLLNLLRPFGSELGPTSDWPNFNKVSETRKPVIGGIGPVGPLSGLRLLPLRVPVLRSDELKYVLTVALVPDAISQILRNAGTPSSWIGAVVDANGNIVARTIDEQFELGRPESQSVRDAITRASSGEYVGQTLEGTEVEAVYQSLPGLSGWSVHLAIPTEELNKQVVQSVVFLVASGTVSLMLAFLLAWFSARDISQRRSEQDERAALALELSEERRTLAINAADLGVLSIDPNSKQVISSPRTRELLGRDTNEGSNGDTLANFLGHIDDRDRPQVAEALTQQGEQQAAIEFRTRSGHWRRLSGHTATRRSKDGTVNAVILDIDAVKKVEADRIGLLRRLSDTQENERRRIARELHDQIGQVVTGLLLGLKSLEQSFRAKSLLDEDSVDKLHWLQRLADQIGQDIHQVAADLRPTAVDDLGVAKALDAFCADWNARFKIRIDLQTLGSQERVTTDVEIALYRIVQEALNNVLKHSQATNVSIVLDQRPHEYRLIIEDDGVGMLPAALTTDAESIGPGLGLSGIRERLALLRGSLLIETARGAGTTLFVAIPLTSRMTVDEIATRHAV
ncbi:MAG: sensor histidine kinase [Oxalobacteraceae bacterium]|nr:MAG: sensor histidine kinase [Oxalobacteraceae bacterium]